MLKQNIENLLMPIVQSLGYELWACEYIPQGKYSLLRVYIDKKSGIHIDDCEVVAREINAILDVEDPIPGNYSLEVSSPGIPKPLFSIDHFSRFIGRMVSLKLRKLLQGSKKLQGTILSVTNNVITLQVNQETVQVDFFDVLKANLSDE